MVDFVGIDDDARRDIVEAYIRWFDKHTEPRAIFIVTEPGQTETGIRVRQLVPWRRVRPHDSVLWLQPPMARWNQHALALQQIQSFVGERTYVGVAFIPDIHKMRWTFASEQVAPGRKGSKFRFVSYDTDVPRTHEARLLRLSPERVTQNPPVAPSFALQKVDQSVAGVVGPNSLRGFGCRRCVNFDADASSCRIVHGNINWRGCCNLWGERKRTQKVTKAEAGYIEVVRPNGKPYDYTCRECVFWLRFPEQRPGTCRIVNGYLPPLASCNLWNNSETYARQNPDTSLMAQLMGIKPVNVLLSDVVTGEPSQSLLEAILADIWSIVPVFGDATNIQRPIKLLKTQGHPIRAYIMSVDEALTMADMSWMGVVPVAGPILQTVAKWILRMFPANTIIFLVERAVTNPTVITVPHAALDMTPVHHTDWAAERFARFIRQAIK